MKIKKKKHKNIFLKIIVIIIIAIFCSFILIKYYSKQITPGLITYANDEVTRLTTLVINSSLNSDIINNLEDNDIFEIIKNNNGEIQLISYNTKNVNILLTSIANIIQNNLEAISNGNIDFLNFSDSFFKQYNKDLLLEGIISEIPFGSLMDSTLLSNIGPKIPIKFSLIGDVTTNLKTDVKEYGINNALLNVSIEIIVNFRVSLPFTSDKITINNVFPISMKVIQGSIPSYYSGGFENSYGLIN